VNERSRPNPVALGQPSPLSGALETIAAGLSLAIARPYLIIVPLLVDLATWLGVQVSAMSLIEPLRETMRDQGGRSGPEAAEQLAVIGERFRVNDVAAILTPSIFAGLPRDSLLNALVSVLASPVSDGVDRRHIGGTLTDGMFELWVPGEWWTVLGVMAALFAVATILIVLFRVPIARAVRKSGDQRSLLADTLLAWLRLIGVLGLAAVAAALVIGPFIIGSAVLLLLGLDVVGLLVVALVLFGGLASIYLLFVLDALFLERLGPIAAIERSASIVRANFGSTCRFALASLVLATGALQVWSQITHLAPGVVIAILGNALLGTGLSIASMMFFQDRAAALATAQPPPGRSRWRS
jgi:hypothetical protein